MAKKYYAVKKGRQVGIYTSWNETKELVQGYSGAEYASFPTKKQAKEYMDGYLTKNQIIEKEEEKQQEKQQKITNKIKKNIDEYESGFKDTQFDFEVYTDGSFKDGTYSYAYLFVQNGEKTPIEDSGIGDTGINELDKLQNIAGEMKAVIEAVRVAVEMNVKILIRHDYLGVAYWVINDPKYGHPWKARKEFTKKYAEFMKKYRKFYEFKHIKGHSSDEFNDYVDKLAKQELGIK